MNQHASLPPEARGDPWFEDGNIVLIAASPNAAEDTTKQPVAFRVHRGVLSRHSEIFHTMFQMPQNPSDAEMLDGCFVVRMYDLPNELSSLIKALYDGVTFSQRSAEDFFFLAGILRLASKYFIPFLRLQAIRYLTQTWAHTLRGHDTMVSTALSSPEIDGMTYPYVHPLHVLNLAREVNVQIVVPSALYFLSIYPLTDLIRADHPKLRVEHPSRPSSQLSAQDIRDYTLMYQHRINLLLDFIRETCANRPASSDCERAQDHSLDSSQQCRKNFSRLAHYSYQAFSPRAGPFHNMDQAVKWAETDSTLCSRCQRAFRTDVTALRERLWAELPSIVGLPGWEQLEEIDLAPQASF